MNCCKLPCSAAIDVGVMRHERVISHRHGDLALKKRGASLEKWTDLRINYAANRVFISFNYDVAFFVDLSIVHHFAKLDHQAGADFSEYLLPQVFWRKRAAQSAHALCVQMGNYLFGILQGASD